jgi:FKBP-type peptidyl-prolyl cis-trans isomerase
MVRLPNLLLLSLLIVLTSCFKEDRYDNTKDLEFLEENAQRSDVTVRPSGLQVRVISEGNAEGRTPEEESIVRVHYLGKLVSGKVFEDTRERDMPLQLKVEEQVDGFIEGLKLMKPGAKYELVIPPQLGFGNFPPSGSPIPPGAVLIIEVELLEVLTLEEAFIEAYLRDYPNTIKTPEGAYLRYLRRGSGRRPVNQNTTVQIHYTGYLIEGEEFDNNYDMADPFLRISELHKGLREAMLHIPAGSEFELVVPADLGYGVTPPDDSGIPAHATLIFDVVFYAIR